MLIESIEVINFLSYYDKNVFGFDSGPTLLLGQNNTGKSKLFDAFNWVLYDRAFHTEEEEWFLTNHWQHELVNSKARKECKIDEPVTTEVILSFKIENGDQYILSRNYRIIKSQENSWICDSKSSIYLEKKDAITANYSSYRDGEVIDIINTFFPANLSKYFLFQGENISRIMSLGKKSAFNDALHDLSRIEVFELARDYSQKTLNRCKKELNEKTDANHRIQFEKLELDKQINLIDKDINNRTQGFEDDNSQRDIAKELLDKRESQLRSYEECADILRSIASIESRINLLNNNRDTLYESRSRPLFEHWVYAGLIPILANFLEIYSKNKVEKKIPEPIRQDFIREMLQGQICEVCGREAKKDTECYHHIESFINDQSLDSELALINTLSFTSDAMIPRINEIPKDIEEFYNALSNIDNELASLQIELKSKKEILRGVIPKGLSEDSVQLREFEEIRDSVLELKRQVSKYNDSMNRLSGIIEQLKNDKGRIEQKYDEVIKQSEAKEETERYELAKKIAVSTSQFYEHFIKKLIDNIELETNRCFQKMTELNPALSGQVKVDRGESEVYTVDESENRLTNINQANKVSLQIAFVAAVLSVSNSFWGTHFPFIADAPISALGGNNKLAAIKTMNSIFEQSILILKDDAVTSEPDSIKNDLIRQLIREDGNIKNSYELSMIGGTLEEQHTKVVKIC